jgi:hypothetical protein
MAQETLILGFGIVVNIADFCKVFPDVFELSNDGLRYKKKIEELCEIYNYHDRDGKLMNNVVKSINLMDDTQQYYPICQELSKLQSNYNVYLFHKDANVDNVFICSKNYFNHTSHRKSHNNYDHELNFNHLSQYNEFLRKFVDNYFPGYNISLKLYCFS